MVARGFQGERAWDSLFSAFQSPAGLKFFIAKCGETAGLWTQTSGEAGTALLRMHRMETSIKPTTDA